MIVVAWKYVLVCNFLLEISTSTQVIKLKLERNKFLKLRVYNLHTRIWFSKKSRDQDKKIIDQLHLTKIIPNVSSSFM